MRSLNLFLLLIFYNFSAAQINNGSFQLINANTDTVIKTFSEDITHYLIEADSINVVALPNNTYDQIKFNLSDGYSRTEGTAPYACWGDMSGDYGHIDGVSQYFGWRASEGS
ncbi:hypothetical protein [Cytophaga sp. FL35]|uniref:hypothetical protein n=1 Tax=Cytophaga sp. FL35 TaxID=1904456 RepID=UPI001653702A|nr:hypothetical protein [Cytophaga sp. FL35]MBC6999645.1 hypothetical protein [Cytophaga sp. FL35]